MDIQIAGRSIEVADALKERLESKLPPVLADYPRVENCQVILSQEKFRHSCTITVQGRDKMHITGAATSDADMISAIDLAIDKLDKQLRRSREKMLDRQKARERLGDVPEADAPVDLA